MADRLGWETPDPGLTHSTFAPEFAQQVIEHAAGSDHSVWSLWRNFEQKLLSRELISQLSTRPLNRDHFLASLDTILSDTAKAQIIDKTNQFDILTGSNISDVLLNSQSLQYWLLLLLEQVFRCHGRLKKRAEDRLWIYKTLLQLKRRVCSKLMGRLLALFRYTWDGSPREPLRQQGSLNKVIQVHLEGSSLLAAWKQNHMIAEQELLLSQDESCPGTDQHQIFHATKRLPDFRSAHCRKPFDYRANYIGDFFELEYSDEGDQMVPRGVHGFYTSFSLLRTYLWTAFQARLFSGIPHPIMADALRQGWQSRGRCFSGLPVICRTVNLQEFAENHTIVALDAKQSEAFTHQVTDVQPTGPFGWVSSDDAWVAFKSTHQSDLVSWPDVMHYDDSGEQKSMWNLLACGSRRTFWNHKDVRDFLSSPTLTLAIDFTWKPER